ncbi:MAG: type III pantothenate kinase [Lysobacterales bacterium]
MSRLLFDFGNSRLKWASTGTEGIGPSQAVVVTTTDWIEQVSRALSQYQPPREIAIAAVAADAKLRSLVALLERQWPDLRVQIVQSRRQLGRLHSAYVEPERLGVDRFLACAAAAADAADRLVVAVGTALTIDWVAASGVHRGGLILPAPELMRSALLAETARIGWRREGTYVDFAVNSEDALISGVWAGACGAVERSFARAQQRSAADLQLIVHGGDAATLIRHLDLPTARIQRRPNLVFEGMCLWLDEGAGARG